MPGNISPLISLVNKRAVLTSGRAANRLVVMRYGERLSYAREQLRKWTQRELSERSNVSQGLISQLESSLTATGSQYTVRLARALAISADWLADEEGEIEPVIYHVTDPEIREALAIMEALPKYALKEAVKSIEGIATLIEHKTPNGTSG